MDNDTEARRMELMRERAELTPELASLQTKLANKDHRDHHGRRVDFVTWNKERQRLLKANVRIVSRLTEIKQELRVISSEDQSWKKRLGNRAVPSCGDSLRLSIGSATPG